MSPAAYSRAQREAKATDLEQIVVEAGCVEPDDLTEQVKAAALAVLAERRGKTRETASEDTWALVRHFLAGRIRPGRVIR